MLLLIWIKRRVWGYLFPRIWKGILKVIIPSRQIFWRNFQLRLSDVVPDDHHLRHFSLRPPRRDTTRSMYWKRSPASNTLLSTYLGADAMAKGRWWKTCRLKRTVETARARDSEIRNKSCRNPGQPSRVVASLPHSRYKEMLLTVSQRGEMVSDPQVVCYWWSCPHRGGCAGRRRAASPRLMSVSSNRLLLAEGSRAGIPSLSSGERMGVLMFYFIFQLCFHCHRVGGEN